MNKLFLGGICGALLVVVVAMAVAPPRGASEAPLVAAPTVQVGDSVLVCLHEYPQTPNPYNYMLGELLQLDRDVVVIRWKEQSDRVSVFPMANVVAVLGAPDGAGGLSPANAPEPEEEVDELVEDLRNMPGFEE